MPDPAPALNQLADQTSPYLLQHAGNPVHWRPWGEAALAEAARLDRPILLSIGYAACHWCHVMAHESFEDPATAELMNTLYVNIKVDREERPDLDHLYMSALNVLGEQGGWPLTMFLAPDGTPFWGGTYFPPEPRWGKPGFRQVLQGVADAWHRQHGEILHNAGLIAGSIAALSAAHPGRLPGPADLDRAAAHLLAATDPVHGGLRGAPKFPNAPVFRFLWQDAFRTGAEPGRAATLLLLERMSAGGIYDHLGGGYARYSTDAVWLAPHFEKMLYDNAQILDLLALAHAAAPSPLWAARAAGIVAWLTRDMAAAPVGEAAAFAASEDADSEGEEGRFYVWTEAEIDQVLGGASEAFKAAYDVTSAGNWEGRTILRRITAPGAPAAEAALASARAVLFAARTHRVRPARDDKVLADWNGLAIAALCRAGAVFRRPDWIARAVAAFDAIDAAMMAQDGRVAHAWRLGRIGAAGLLDDQAAMARAALALFEATAEPRYLAAARRLVATAETWFADASGSCFLTASDAADLPFGPTGRPRTIADSATPSGNGLLAEVLARLWHLTGEEACRQRAEALISAFGGLGDNFSAAPTLLAALDLLEEGAVVVVTGPQADPEAEALLAAARAAPDPAVAVLRAATADALAATHPAFGKPVATTAAFLCRGGVCGLPITHADDLAQSLRQRRLK